MPSFYKQFCSFSNMEKTFFIFIFAAAFLAIASGVPTWKNEEIDDVSPSSLEIAKRNCRCSKDHHECGCCLQIRARVYQKITANVCLNASYVPSRLAVDFMMTWNKHTMFNKTISDAHPPPICFNVPGLKDVKTCVKFSKVSLKKPHVGACGALGLKAKQVEKHVPLGCFFFRGVEGEDLEFGTFLDRESLNLLLEDFLLSSMGSLIPDTDSLDDDVTNLVTANKGHCECGKSPPHCDCCVEAKVLHFPVKACAHGVVDKTGTGFTLSLDVNGLKVFDKHISVAKPITLCHEFHIFHHDVKICAKLTNVSLTPGHTGGCLEVDINSTKLSFGCFYMTGYQGIE